MKLVFGDDAAIRELRRAKDASLRRYGSKTLKKSEYMRDQYGAKPGEFCRDCLWLKLHAHWSTNVSKCRKYGESRSTATDWRQKWAACGLFVKGSEVVDETKKQ